MRNPSPFLIVFPVGAALFSACNSTAKSSKEAQTNQKPNIISFTSYLLCNKFTLTCFILKKKAHFNNQGIQIV